MISISATINLHNQDEIETGDYEASKVEDLPSVYADMVRDLALDGKDISSVVFVVVFDVLQEEITG